MSERWSAVERVNLDTGERQILVERTGVVRGHIVKCWVVEEEAVQTAIETPPEESEEE
jgi:hypothetical protein